MEYHLKRFFIEADKEHKVTRDFVFIYSMEDLDDQFFLDTNVSLPRSWEHYKDYQSIVLLGPPRQGKTTEFEYQCSQVVNGFFLPLRELPTTGELHRFELAIKNGTEWTTWKTSEEEGELFIDALDEAKITTRSVMNDLVAWIKSLESKIRSRLRIHISCRTADWDKLDQESWENLFVPGKVAIISLLDLDRKRYEEYCRRKDIDGKELLRVVPIRARQFVAKPLTLETVAEHFKNTGTVPSNTQELYDEAISRLLEEINQAYQRSRLGSSRARGKIAEFLASLTILSDREPISTNSGSSNDCVNVGDSNFDREDMIATLNSGLFRTHAQGRFRFDDPELAEYLAARRLNRLIDEEAISPKMALCLFLGDPSHKEPVPKLRGTLVWLAALNSSFKRLVIELNPGVLLNNFPGDLSSEDKIIIWKWLKTKYADRAYFDIYKWHYGVSAIACPEILCELKEVIASPGRYGRDLRILAIEIAQKGNLTELVPTLERLIQNTSDNPHVLIYAADALIELAPDRTVCLKTWLDLPPEQDPENRLLAKALSTLWPEHISLQELIDCLRPQLRKQPLNGGLWSFLYELPAKLDVAERAKVIESMAADLETIVATNNSQIDTGTRPSQHIVRFLLLQIEAWQDNHNYLPELERWITSAYKANHLLIIYQIDKLSRLIKQNHSLRQALAKQYLERISIEESNEFYISIYPIPEFAHPHKEDLVFWQNTLLSWQDRDDSLIENAWEMLRQVWEQTDLNPELLEWFERQSCQYPKIKLRWDAWRAQKLPPEEHYYQRKDFLRRRKEKNRRQKEIAYIRQHIDEIKLGNIKLLYHLAFEQSQEKSIEETYGTEVLLAYKQGLRAAWEKHELPPLSDYYPDSFLYLARIIVQAVNMWHQESEESWPDISKSMRISALQAAITERDLPREWFDDLVNLEPAAFQAKAHEALRMENGKGYHVFANDLAYKKGNQLYRQAAFSFLQANPDVKDEMLLPLAKASIADEYDKELVDFLWGLVEQRFTGEKNEIALNLLGIIWRYEPRSVWKFLDRNFLDCDLVREERFGKWIKALMLVHDSPHPAAWPAWTTNQHIMDMLPDLFCYFPPDTDPSTEKFNRGDRKIQHRSHIGKLRVSALQLLAKSGTIESRDCIDNILNRDISKKSRDSLLLALDKWQEAYATRTWQPLSQEDLEAVLTKGKRPIQSHEDLFNLAVEMIEEIKDNILDGEADIATLFWDGNDPAHERKFQIYMFDRIKNHRLGSKIVSSREVEVKGGKQPDIKIQISLPSGKAAKVYIEIKLQKNQELFSAIKEQLADKYLRDPESRYGIYLVGWYGPNFWGPSKKKTNETYGCIPKTEQELEICLQNLADDVVRDIPGIKAIKVIVINLSEK